MTFIIDTESECWSDIDAVVTYRQIKVIICTKPQDTDCSDAGKLFNKVDFSRCGDVAPLNSGSTDEQKR